MRAFHTPAVSSRRIVTSFANHERLDRAAEHLRAAAPDAGCLVLAPTRTAAADFVRAAAPPGGGFLGVHCFTLRSLAAALAADAIHARRLAPLGRLGLEAVAARAVYACRAEGALRYFAPVADTPGFARSLASTLSELRLEGLVPSWIAEAGPAGRDLARLLARYEHELDAQSLADLAVLYRLAAEAAAHQPHRLLGLPLLLLDLSLPSRAEAGLLAAVAARAPSVFATLPASDHESIAALQALLEISAEPAAPAGPAASTLARLQLHLFARDIPPDGPPDDTFEFFSAAGEGLESVEIARRILRLAREGLPFDRIAVLLRSPGGYLPLVEDALRRAGVPAWFSRSAARPDPSGRAFLALLACAAEGLTASRFAEYLSLGQVPREPRDLPWAPPGPDALETLKPPSEPEEPPPEPPPAGEDEPIVAGTLQAPFVWEKLLVDAAVIGGRDRWERRLRGLERHYRLRLSALAQEADPRRSHYERELLRLENLRRFALPLIDLLGAWPPRAMWGDWLDRLAVLAGRALRDPEPVVAVLSELRPMAEVGPVTLDEVRAVLSDCLGSLRPEPRGPRYGKVFVGAVEEARGRSFDVVFVPGLAEGLFPRPPLEDHLLLDDLRRSLPGRLALEDQRVLRERLLLQTAAGAARTRLVASFPRLDVTIGRPRVPSFYALELWRAAEGRLPDLPRMEKRATRAAPAQLGWPAPLETADAIDDAEYDLAWLGRLLRERRTNQRGSSRYLLEANPHLERSLRARGRRWRPSWFESDGLVRPDAETLGLLAPYRLVSRPYSPTALQQYAACPYKFLLYAVHQLRPRDTAVAIEQLDPLDRGKLFHDAQYELFRDLQASGLLPVTAQNLPEVLDRADRALNLVAERYREELAPAIEQVWRTAIEELRTDLRGWIFELPALHAEWLPVHFELSFGFADDELHDPASVPGPALILDGVRLRGRIDLVERHRLTGVLRITDHKTGKAPDPPPVSIGHGEQLQPALYGLAVESLLRTPVEAGVLFYATQRGGRRAIPIRLSPETRRRAAAALQTIDDALQKGFLPAAPRTDACGWCDYRPVCGPYEERRVQKKDPGPLDALLALRNHP